MGNSVKVDQKGRLKIPVTLLSTLNHHDTEFYVTSEDGDCVRIYPMRVWNQVEERLKQLSSRNRGSEKLLARAKYFGSAVTVDKQGRLLIPIGLRKSAHMQGAVDILDYLPYLEVWNHARFLKRLKNSPTSAEDEETLDKCISNLRLPWAMQPKKRRENVFGEDRRFGMNRRMHRHRTSSAIPLIRDPQTAPTRHPNMN